MRLTADFLLGQEPLPKCWAWFLLEALPVIPPICVQLDFFSAAELVWGLYHRLSARFDMIAVWDGHDSS